MYSLKRTGALSSLVQGTVKNVKLIDQLIEKSGLKTESRLDSNLARILVYELLFGKKTLAGGSKPVNTVLTYEKPLRRELKLINSQSNEDHNLTENESVNIPRYVKVNTLKISFEKAVKLLRKENYNEIQLEEDVSFKKYKKHLKSLEPGCFIKDPHVPDLLAFHSKEQFHEHHLYQEYKILLQNKSSCFPPLLLNPPSGSIVLDACAAPGMKTCHLANLMNNIGHIYAVDLSSERLSFLDSFLKDAGATCVEPVNADFTNLDYSKPPYNKVQYILLDPSCTGSGMPSRLLEETTRDEGRLRSITAFQFKLLSHALSFPSVERVVYSTCSVYPEENECVVKGALKAFRHKFVLERALPWWHRRPSDDFPEVEGAVRFDLKDLMCGFFIAVFQRKSIENEEEEEKYDEGGGDDAYPGDYEEEEEQYKKRKKKCKKKKLGKCQE